MIRCNRIGSFQKPSLIATGTLSGAQAVPRRAVLRLLPARCALPVLVAQVDQTGWHQDQERQYAERCNTIGNQAKQEAASLEEGAENVAG
jgi:hypothetical protein